MAWVCPTDACYERCHPWQILDINNELFYLPMPKQAELEEAIASQQYSGICMGGVRAGGKSAALRPIAYRYARSIQGFEAYFLRRSFPQLIRNHTRKAVVEAKRLGAKFASMTMTFPETDGTIEFGHCQDWDDYKNYVGAEADLIIYDQLEQFTDTQYTEISAATSRKRRPNWRGLVLAGENPGGPLSAFVDELFISKTRNRVKYPDYDPTQYFFLNADLIDNPYCDPRYVQQLATIAPEKRAMYRWGRRDVFPGQFFRDFAAPGRVATLQLDPTLPRLGAMRWGYNKPGIFLWCVALPTGALYIEREHVFETTVAAELAIEVRGITAAFGLTLQASYGNREIQDGEGGEDVFETLTKNGLYVQASKHDPISGWQRLRHWLRPLPDGTPALLVNPSCEMLLKTVPQLVQHELHEEDVADGQSTQAAEALRCLVMSRPMPLQGVQTVAHAPGTAGELLDILKRETAQEGILGRWNVAPR